MIEAKTRTEVSLLVELIIYFWVRGIVHQTSTATFCFKTYEMEKLEVFMLEFSNIILNSSSVSCSTSFKIIPIKSTKKGFLLIHVPRKISAFSFKCH